MFAWDKHFNLLGPFVSQEENEVLWIRLPEVQMIFKVTNTLAYFPQDDNYSLKKFYFAAPKSSFHS